jgi:hypothetical protein
MSIHPIQTELVARTQLEDRAREAARRRLVAQAERRTTSVRVTLADRMRAVVRSVRSIGCRPTLGGCAEELVDARSPRPAGTA